MSTQELKHDVERLTLWVQRMTGKENLNSNPMSLPKCQTQDQAEEIRLEMVELRTNLEDLKTRLEDLPEQTTASSMRIGLLERYKEVTKKNLT